MLNKRILFIGNLNSNNQALGGQIIKTVNTKKLLLENNLSNGEDIFYIHLEQYKTDLLKFIFSLRFLLKRRLSIIFMPSSNGLKLLLPIVLLFSKIFNNRIIYIVIGGWLPKLTSKNLFYRFLTSKVDNVLVESKTMLEELNAQNIHKVKVFPNFRFDSLSIPPNIKHNDDKFQVLFIARITKLKGVDFLFALESYIEKNKLSLQGFSINIAGPIDPNYLEDFMTQLKGSKICKNIGIISSDSVYQVINNNDIVVLPSRYPGEGMPGTIIDAYMAAVPVVVSNWRYLPEFVEHDLTGYVFDLNSPEDFFKIIIDLYNNREKLNELKKNASKKRLEFTDKAAATILKQLLRNPIT